MMIPKGFDKANKIQRVKEEKIKAQNFIKSQNFKLETPEIKDPVLWELVSDYMTESEALANSYIAALNQIK